MKRSKKIIEEKPLKRWQRISFVWTWIALAAFLTFSAGSLISSLLMSAFGVPSTLMSMLSWLFGAVAGSWVVWRWWQRPIAPHLLTKPANSKTVARRWPNSKNHLQEKDEVWHWSASGRTWERLAGVEGLVIVRDGKPTRHYIALELE